MTWCNIVEPDEQLIAHNLGGLRAEISDVVQLQTYWTYNDVCKLAMKVEKQLKERRSSSLQSYNWEGVSNQRSGSTLHLRQPLLSNHQRMNLHQALMWVCALGNCCRCIFMLYCVHGHQDVIISIHVIWVTLLSSCMRHTSICLMLWRVSAHPSTSMLARVVYIGMKHCRCAIAHQTQNSAGFSPWKLGLSIVVFS